MISVLVVRRFKTHGPSIEVARVLDLPSLPLHGYQLVFEDGSGEAGVAAMRMRAWPSPRDPGVYPVAVEIRTGTEPVERLEPALLAGWTRLEFAGAGAA